MRNPRLKRLPATRAGALTDIGEDGTPYVTREASPRSSYPNEAVAAKLLFGEVTLIEAGRPVAGPHLKSRRTGEVRGGLVAAGSKGDVYRVALDGLPAVAPPLLWE